MKSTSLSPAFVRHTLAAAAMAVGSLCASSAMAVVVDTESNDPTGSYGSLSFTNAQLVGSGSETITGTTNPLQDVDLFRFDVTAGLFSVDLVDMLKTPGTADGYQTHLLLMDAGKNVLDFDYDASDANGTMGIQFSMNLAAGTYYLAVAGMNNHAMTIYDGFAYDMGGPVGYWNGFGQGTGSYTINVTSVPEADTYAMLLAGLGLTGFAVRRRQANLA